MKFLALVLVITAAGLLWVWVIRALLADRPYIDISTHEPKRCEVCGRLK